MDLSTELISQFAKITNDDKNTKEETTVYGTTVEYEGKMYVKLDGSDRLTPISTTTDMEPDERVTVMIKNHTATVTGNISSPAARTDTVKEVSNEVTRVNEVVANKVDTVQLAAQIARIDTLTSENVTIKETLTATNADIVNLKAVDAEITGKLTAAEADIKKLDAEKITADFVEAEYAKIKDLEATNLKVNNLEAAYGSFKDLTTDKLTALDASIKDLDAKKLSAEAADIKFATIDNLNAANANITKLTADIAELETAHIEDLKALDATIVDLDAKNLKAEVADLRYANIDFSNIGKAAIEAFYAKSGIIKDLVVGDATVSGEIVGVTISGDLLKANTVKADKLVVLGSDGLYYKLNFEGGTFTGGEEVPTDSLHGSVITAKSITAEKVSVKDLVAFDATIGGFHITNNAIYSGAKESVGNATRGIYLDNTGQIAFGDSSNFIKYYKDQNGNYRLEISSDQIALLAKKTEVKTMIDGVEVGARNLIRNSTSMIFEGYGFASGEVELIVTHDDAGNVTVISGMTVYSDGAGNLTTTDVNAIDDGAGNVIITK